MNWWIICMLEKHFNQHPDKNITYVDIWVSTYLKCFWLFSFTDDEKRDGNKNEDTVISSPISRIDKGTQMSPPETENDDQHSSPKSSPTWAMDQKNCYSAKLEIRDVQVDSQATVIRWPKSYVSKLSSLHGKDLKKSSMEVQASGLDIADSTLDDSKYVR